MTKEKSKRDENLKYKIWGNIAVMTTYLNGKT